jgi:hypothetical protein
LLKPSISTAAAAAQLHALMGLLSNGFIDIYEGAMPDSANDATSQNALRLVSCKLGPSSFQLKNGVAKLNEPARGTAEVNGHAEWYRLYQADHVTAIADGTVGTSKANLLIESTKIKAKAVITVEELNLGIKAAA